jgi:hypothetical protein
MQCAPVAQLDRAPGYEPVGRRFESFRAHQNLLQIHYNPVIILHKYFLALNSGKDPLYAV